MVKFMYNISTFRLCNLIKYQLISKDTLCIVLSKFHQKYVQNLKNKLYNFIIINIHNKKLSKSCIVKQAQLFEQTAFTTFLQQKHATTF
jgi:hypothetical protein